MSTEQHASSGTLPEDYVGAEEHGPGLSEGAGDRARRRKLASVVWGGVERDVTSEHGGACGYCGTTWPTGVGMPPNTHPGLDISMVRGTKLFAAKAGKVVFAGWDPQFYRPHHVDIVTPNGERHIYAHMWSVASGIADGVEVTAGQLIGTSGEQTKKGTMTPDGTGGHLHFEARRTSNGHAIDPNPILADSGGSGQPEPAFSTGDRIAVDVAELNFRDQPATGSTVIAKLARGTRLCVTGGSRDAGGYRWSPVRDEQGRTGWLAARFCTLVESGACGFAVNDRLRVNTRSLRLRSEPGTGGQIVRSLPSGTELCVTGDPRDADGYVWSPVTVRDGGATGWVAAKYCELVEANGCGNGGESPDPGGDRALAEAIDRRVALSNRVNNRQSKLTGMGARFVELGRRYGVRPEIACAIIQRECQMGADGSQLPEKYNNFGGLTAGRNNARPGTCGTEFYKDRTWMVFCTPEEGLEGVFQVLASDIYRQTGGRFEEIMNLYSPAFENDWTAMWKIFTTVGEQLGVGIDKDTRIYTA